MIELLDRQHDQRPAVVMVPGLAATAEFFGAAVSRLAARHRVVVVELPGHGDNSTAGRPASLAHAVAQLHTTIDELGLTDITLLGWSLGATVTYGYLERFGTDRVRRLVSVEQTPRLLVDDDWPYGAFGALDAAGASAIVQSVTSDYPAFAAGLVRNSFAAADGEDTADTKDAGDGEDSGAVDTAGDGDTAADRGGPDPATLSVLTDEACDCEPDAVAALLREAIAADWRDRIRSIPVPTLLIHGTRSQVYPGDLGRWLRDAIPQARLEMFDHSGHLPFVEEPDRFARTVAAFVGDPVGT
ncbi:alpha/beta hydrolase [Solwaraspora sp. WMMD406]|uniref:alpha/beta fold hydrolase n=1 Tax=Solwaraspora sp. WMMD406 TaxID=3016095 RepID=UPI00241801C3|nr:alpha/beta hydrolase [Solwaraspora sp. WMMD406]MDG4765794.1 alpha/beta hydrolase [Solwaraspora sp. WMMD406]